MSAEITRYVLVDESDVEGDYEYDTKNEAIGVAVARGHHAVIERTYVYDDSTLVWTPDGSDTWPPEKDDWLVDFLVNTVADGFTRPGEAKAAAEHIRKYMKGETDAGN